jgi:hypothetical protein
VKLDVEASVRQGVKTSSRRIPKRRGLNLKLQRNFLVILAGRSCLPTSLLGGVGRG